MKNLANSLAEVAKFFIPCSETLPYQLGMALLPPFFLLTQVSFYEKVNYLFTYKRSK